MMIDQMELPPGWVWTIMGEIADIVGGGTPKTKVPANYEGGTIPWLTPADLSGYSEKHISHGARYITQKGLDSSSAKMLPAGTVLFTSRAPIGYVAIASNSVCTNQGFKSFVLRKGVLPDYVYWWLKGSKGLAESMASGTTFLELSGAKAKQLPIPIAPIDQQQRIVAEIEKQFSRLDEAVANLKRVKANLKRYKAAVLKAAVEGKLIDAAVDGGLFAEGQWRSVGSVLLSIDQGWSPRCEKNPVAAAGDWGVIKTTAVQEFRFDQIENKKLPSALEPRPNLEIKVGDLLITRAGPRKRVGVTCLVRSTQPGLMICDKVYRLRCDASKIRPAYLELVLNAPQVLEKLNELKTGISDSGVNLTQKRFRGLSIPVPSLSTQALLEAEVERIVSTCEAIDGTCQAELLRADRLRQSILTKAFSGA